MLNRWIKQQHHKDHRSLPWSWYGFNRNSRKTFYRFISFPKRQPICIFWKPNFHAFNSNRQARPIFPNTWIPAKRFGQKYFFYLWLLLNDNKVILQISSFPKLWTYSDFEAHHPRKVPIQWDQKVIEIYYGARFE